MTNEISRIIVPVMHYGRGNGVTEEAVAFKIFRDDNRIKAIPLISKEERVSTGLPEELEFVYVNHCVAAANDMEEETLDAIKQIILELETQDLL